jgi:uncharacterized protein (UPF0332 family)
MSYEGLIKRGKIVPSHASIKEVRSLLDVAKRDLRTAEQTLDIDIDWCYSITYNAILQASRALMLSHGYRPRGGQEHLTVVQFLREALGDKYGKEVSLFDQMRRKRHQAIYERAGLVGHNEVEDALTFARKFVAMLSRLTEEKLVSDE